MRFFNIFYCAFRRRNCCWNLNIAPSKLAIRMFKDAIYDFKADTLRCPECYACIDFYDSEERVLTRKGVMIGKVLRCRNGHQSKEMLSQPNLEA